MLRTFITGTEAPFFSVDRHTPLTVFHKMLRTFTTEAPIFSVARDIPLFFNFLLQNVADFHYLNAIFFQYYPNNNWVIALL
jgi:hypothetical protein